MTFNLSLRTSRLTITFPPQLGGGGVRAALLWDVCSPRCPLSLQVATLRRTREPTSRSPSSRNCSAASGGPRSSCERTSSSGCPCSRPPSALWGNSACTSPCGPPTGFSAPAGTPKRTRTSSSTLGVKVKGALVFFC